MNHGHGIPSGTMSFQIVGAYNAPCKIWYINKNDFWVFYDGIIIVVRHHDSFALRQALSSPYFLQTTYIPTREVIRVWIAQERFPLRFFMTSGELQPCDTKKAR